LHLPLLAVKMRIVEDGQVGELRRWAQGLATDTRPEVQAAAKAITLLADDLDAARSQLLEERMIREALEENQLERDLRTRLRARLTRRD
jgi:hypothetical protein